MSALQFAGLLIGLLLMAWALAFALGCGKAAKDADEEMERQWEQMKGERE